MNAVDTKALIYEKADSIANAISSSEAAGRYWQARTKMKAHEQAQQLFDELKLKRNTSLILEQRLDKDHPKMMLADMEVSALEEKLNEIPVAQQYYEAQAELNELLQGVVSLLLSRLTDELPVEIGPRQGCGKGHDGNGCSCGKN